jgi:cytochrome c5
MKKKNLIIKKIGRNGLCIVAGCLILSCSSSDDSEDIMEMDDMNNSGAVTYEANIRQIVQSNCLTCHTNPPVNGAPMSLTTYNDVRNAVDQRGLLGRINSVANPMPPTGLMGQSLRQEFQDWADQGFPEN